MTQNSKSKTLGIKQKLENVIKNSKKNDVSQLLFQKEQQYNSLCNLIQTTVTNVNNHMINIQIVQQFSSHSKDPKVLLQFLQDIFKQLVSMLKYKLQNSSLWLLQGIINKYCNKENRDHCQYIATKALQNYNISRQHKELCYKYQIMKATLKASEEACKTIITNANQTIQAIKGQFKQVLDILQQSQKKLNQTITINKNLEIEKQKLEIVLNQVKKTYKGKDYYNRMEDKHINVIKNQYEQKIKALQTKYKLLWSEYTKIGQK